MENVQEKEICIRKAVYEDIKSIHEIEVESFTMPWSEESIMSSLIRDNTYFVVAQLLDSVVGYAGIYFIKPEAYLYNISVKKTYQGIGIGTKIMHELKSYCIRNSMKSLSLEVRESNKGAITFYKNMSFEILGSRKKFYSNPCENATIMTTYF